MSRAAATYPKVKHSLTIDPEISAAAKKLAEEESRELSSLYEYAVKLYLRERKYI